MAEKFSKNTVQLWSAFKMSQGFALQVKVLDAYNNYGSRFEAGGNSVKSLNHVV